MFHRRNSGINVVEPEEAAITAFNRKNSGVLTALNRKNNGVNGLEPEKRGVNGVESEKKGR